MEQNTTAILLCAGKGTRMQDDRTHKVCFEIAGVPAILRLIRNFRVAGVSRFVVVVGHQAEQVCKTLEGIPDILFSYQKSQTGTADAAKCALQTLADENIDGPILLTMGDKLLRPDAIKTLMYSAKNSRADISLLAQPIETHPNGGRVVMRGGRFFSLVERMDALRLRLMNKTDAEILKNPEFSMLGEKKQALLLHTAQNDRATQRTCLPSPTEEVTVEDLDRVTLANSAVYYFRSAATARELMGCLKNDNAQGEWYLTDAVNCARKRGLDVNVLPIEKESILTYSTKEELAEVNRFIEEKENVSHSQTVSKWIMDFETGALDNRLSAIYGPHCDPEKRREPYLRVLRAFYEAYGERDVLLSRAPGRVNLMGRHIEHRGGSTNILAIDRETITVVSPRQDSLVCLQNTDAEFEKTEFDISDIMRICQTPDWVEFIESDKILEMVSQTRGNWANYIKAGILRLQLHNPNKPLCGMDMMFTGNIPMAAGLSSSSSLVVATMEAVISLNHLMLEVQDFVALSGEGEWFVGSRGGAGDHAAMKCGQRGRITHMKFFPFSVGESVPWPDNYDILVANSGIKAKKSGGAKDKFNAMVTSYELAYLYVKMTFPEYADKIHCLRDINAQNLAVSEARIYEILRAVPLSVAHEDVYTLFPEQYHARIRQALSTHAPLTEYRLRGVLLYGLSECARAEHCIDLLRASDYERLGELMCLSHNGDRVWQNGKPYAAEESDEYLDGLIAALASEDASTVDAARLYNQPGVYACSTKEIDMLIDFIISRPGVLGAQLSGAGLGGCVIALVEKEHTQRLIDSLNKIYYAKKGLPPSANVFTPVAGSLVF